MADYDVFNLEEKWFEEPEPVNYESGVQNGVPARVPSIVIDEDGGAVHICKTPNPTTRNAGWTKYSTGGGGGGDDGFVVHFTIDEDYEGEYDDKEYTPLKADKTIAEIKEAADNNEGVKCFLTLYDGFCIGGVLGEAKSNSCDFMTYPILGQDKDDMYAMWWLIDYTSESCMAESFYEDLSGGGGVTSEGDLVIYLDIAPTSLDVDGTPIYTGATVSYNGDTVRASDIGELMKDVSRYIVLRSAYQVPGGTEQTLYYPLIQRTKTTNDNKFYDYYTFASTGIGLDSAAPINSETFIVGTAYDGDVEVSASVVYRSGRAGAFYASADATVDLSTSQYTISSVTSSDPSRPFNAYYITAAYKANEDVYIDVTLTATGVRRWIKIPLTFIDDINGDIVFSCSFMESGVFVLIEVMGSDNGQGSLVWSMAQQVLS